MLHSCVLVLTAAITVASACELQAASDDNPQRMIYVVKYGNAKDVATALTSHFKGVAQIEVLPESPSNCLLIRAAPSAIKEVVEVLEKMDRLPRLVTVDVIFLERSPKAKKGNIDRENVKLVPAEFTGPAEAVLKRIDDLVKKGQLGAYKRLQITTAENQTANARLMSSEPYVTAVQSIGGRTHKTVSYRPTGASARVTLRMPADNNVVMDLDAESVWAHVPVENGVSVGKDDDGSTIYLAEFPTAMAQCKNVVIPAGQAVALKDIQTKSQTAENETLIIVSATPVVSGIKRDETKPATHP